MIVPSLPLKLTPVAGKKLLDCLLIVLAIFIPYHQVAQHTFVDFDDDAYLFLNQHVIQGLTWESIVWAFTDNHCSNWHPLTWISHLIDRELFNEHPGGYLLMNVAWHMLAACLVYLAFFKCTQRRIFALTVALFFALHPVNVENVAWASERKSILNAVFWFAAIIAYLDFIAKKSFKAYGLTLIFFILSLFCKAMSVTLPCTLVLIHCLYFVYHADRRSLPEMLRGEWKRIVGPILPLLVLSAYFSFVTTSVQSAILPVDHYLLAGRLINALVSYQRYLVMFFHPTDLAILYPLNMDDLRGFGSTAPAMLVLIVLSVAALLLVRRKPELLIGWCWFLGTLVPVIGLIQVGSQSHADRYLYIPMLGLAFLFPVLFELLGSLESWIRNTAIGSSLTVLGVSMMLATQHQVSFWKNGVTLCQHSLSVTGYYFHPAFSLCLTYERTGRTDELYALIDSALTAEKDAFKRKVFATLKAKKLFGSGNHQAVIEAARIVVDTGLADKTTYAFMALSSFELGQPDQAASYLAKAKAAPELKNTIGILGFPFESQLTLLEAKLTGSGPPESGPTRPADQ